MSAASILDVSRDAATPYHVAVDYNISSMMRMISIHKLVQLQSKAQKSS